MDLRTQKTEEAIRNAFLALRAKQPLEKITIKELCTRARINKSTFYAHYADIYALSDAMQEEVVRDILSRIANGAEYTMDNLELWAKEIALSTLSSHSLTDILFEGREAGKLVTRIDAGVKEIFFRKFPEFAGDPRHMIILSYTVQGAYYAFINNPKIDADTILSVIEEITAAIKPITTK